MPDSDKFTFKQITCTVCNQQISMGGAAYTSHMRAHTRKGDAMEYKRGNHLVFIASKDHSQFLEDNPYAKLGEDPLPGQPKLVWEIPNLSVELPKVDPAAYFITSGEAVKKAERLVCDAYSLAVKTRTFLKKLKAARGLKKYLEATHESNRILIKVKEPRNKGNNPEETE